MKMKKLRACMLVLTFAFAFVACGRGNGGGETTTTGPDASVNGTLPGETTTTPPEDSTTEGQSGSNGENTTAPSDDESTTASPSGPAETKPGQTTIPQDKAGIIAYYNAALAKTPMQRTSYKRTMTKITALAKPLGITLIDEQNLQDNGDVIPLANTTDTKIAPSDLLKLEADWIKDAKCELKGSDAVLTITLKDYALDPVFDPKPGTKGYVSTLDKKTAEDLVCEVSMALGKAILGEGVLKEIDPTQSSFGQSNGKYMVTVDTVSGKIKSLTFSGMQFAEAKAKCKVNIPLVPASVTANVTLRGDFTAVYAPK